MPTQLHERLSSPGPKRILSLDGGGIRGILTLQILAKLESILAERTANPDFRLSDYFDLIGGTSTGAIIAAGLALGWKVEKLQDLYKGLGEKVFKSKPYRLGLLTPKFDTKSLKAYLHRHFDDITLGSDELLTGLAIMLKRADTGSPWLVSNNPHGKYFAATETNYALPNKDFLLKEIVRASTAAPSYFEPELVSVADGVQATFVDGGVSPHNNPSLQLLLLATANSYQLCWETGPENLLMVSCGTGAAETIIDDKNHEDKISAKQAIASLLSLMDDTGNLNETILQWLSFAPNARQIDRELGNLQQDMPGDKHLLTYIRYQSWLDEQWLSEELGLNYSTEDVETLRKMEEPKNIDDLVEIGRRTAGRFVEEAHLPSAFDI